MSRKSLDLFLLIGFASLALGLTFTGFNLSAFRVIFGLPLVLFVPGYALTTAFLPSLAQAFPNRIMYSIGLSFAVTILTGLALNMTFAGLNSALWTGILAGLSLAAGTVALLRRWQDFRAEGEIGQPIVRIRALHAAALAAAALLILGALTITRTAATDEAHPGFTQLWLTPFYPASEQYVEIGLRSAENQAMDYRVQFRLGDKIISEWSPVHLQPDGLWQKVLRVGDAPPGARAEVLVYRLDNPAQVYRHTTLWFTK